ncbi:hypothetical protein M9H77_17408 [Catharanthus roseus]|uniref:Uncharacterized protein n=1 Tax=Catharanthus roseus TaxID=4058 RepID=A0ACC0B4H9_CATRO|nr:hypothetical protein M9H77_17408 [Catharanthus roseus]
MFRTEKGRRSQFTRVGCQACLQVSYDKTIGYYRVKKFHREHNHILANPRVVHFLHSYRNVNTLGMAEAQSMRADSLNAFVSTYLKSRLLLYPFVNKFEMVISKLRQKELEEEYFTSQMTPILNTHLKELEAHTSKILTRNIFSKVQREISIEAILLIHDITEMDDMKLYTITQYLHEGRLLKVDFHMSKSVI